MEQCFGELDVGAVVVIGLSFVSVGVLLSVQNGRTLGSEGRLDNICAATINIGINYKAASTPAEVGVVMGGGIEDSLAVTDSAATVCDRGTAE